MNSWQINISVDIQTSSSYIEVVDKISYKHNFIYISKFKIYKH